MSLFQIFSQKHPEPFFALAKELYPGQFKVWLTVYGPLCILRLLFLKNKKSILCIASLWKKNFTLALQRITVKFTGFDVFCVHLLWLSSPQCVTTSWNSWRTKASWDAATHRLVNRQLAPQLTRWQVVWSYPSWPAYCACVFRILTLWSGWLVLRVTILLKLTGPSTHPTASASVAARSTTWTGWKVVFLSRFAEIS